MGVVRKLRILVREIGKTSCTYNLQRRRNSVENPQTERRLQFQKMATDNLGRAAKSWAWNANADSNIYRNAQ